MKNSLIDKSNFVKTKIKLNSNYLNKNVIILILFFIFMTFFLLNCKYGIFKINLTEPIGIFV